ncbi:MAG: TadE family protein [Actinomycetota bacterium]
MTRSSRGQSTVEFALLLPLVAFVALLVVQFAIIGRDRVMVTHAARVGARSAAVGAGDTAVRRDVVAASGLPSSVVTVEVVRTSDAVTVTVAAAVGVGLPLVGSLFDDVELRAVARMPREPP